MRKYTLKTSLPRISLKCLLYELGKDIKSYVLGQPLIIGDQINNLKKPSYYICTILYNIIYISYFNSSFTMGIVPRKLKIAKVIPLYKSENPELFTNYIPTSILPCLSKILERLMYNRINNFLAEYNILSNKQYGFRENYSTYMAMIDLVDKISSNIDHKNHNIGIFLDLSKAFDTIVGLYISETFTYSKREDIDIYPSCI